MAAIRTFLRLRPSKRASEDIIEGEDGETLKVRVGGGPAGAVGRRPGGGASAPVEYEFKFHRVFPVAVEQDAVFAEVAQPVVDNFLEGFNGTIFAYGSFSSCARPIFIFYCFYSQSRT